MYRLSSRRWLAGLNPSTEIEPALGVKIPVIILIVVDFPAPFGPMKATRSPAAMVNDTLDTAGMMRCLRRPPITNCRLRLVTSIAAGVPSVLGVADALWGTAAALVVLGVVIDGDDSGEKADPAMI